MKKTVRKELAWRYDVVYDNGDVNEIVEAISKEFREAEEQPSIIEININNYGIVVAEKLISMGLPIKKMKELKRGWVEV